MAIKGPEKKSPEDDKTVLTLQEQVLVTGMLRQNTHATVNYTRMPDGQRIHQGITPDDFSELVPVFRMNPFPFLAVARLNVLNIRNDQNLPYGDRNNRLHRYLDAYLALTVKLDRKAFPAGRKVIRGVPVYIPDGLSDMGTDPQTDPSHRTREKIRINKEEIYKKSRQFLHDLFSRELSYSFSISQWKRSAVLKVAQYVYNSMPYNYSGILHPEFSNRSIPITNLDLYTQCRHHALMTQVLLQTCGITSRLMKSELVIDGNYLGPHVNNLVRLEGQWYLLDTTNPTQNQAQKLEVFMRPIPDKHIDLNEKTYRWSFNTPTGIRTYESRSDMHYRIQDNTSNP